jgi:alkanesulfonate monooxygenase SsuD/methylene tetrahydromethanopterin reductase-like flavin-dependent oxidoreductase (luciferase family)
VTDYGHPITFGLSLIPSAGQLDETVELAQAADSAGLDYLAIQDHAYNPEFLDDWTLISYLAARTA